MEVNVLKSKRRRRRKFQVRRKVFGTTERPRLTVTRTGKQIYAQIVDDIAGKTLASASSLGLKLEKGSDTGAAAKVGVALAEKAKSAGVAAVSFDRNGYRYHGRVKALADAARESGLQF